jgi:hypothetical protein
MKIYNSNTDLFKIEDFKGLKYSKNYYNICDVNEDEDWRQFLNDNPKFKEILIKIGDQCFGSDNYNVEEDMFCSFELLGDLSKDKDKVYIQISGDSSLYLVESLKNFAWGYRREERWRIKDWKEM